jgi:hypothetical protein
MYMKHIRMSEKEIAKAGFKKRQLARELGIAHTTLDDLIKKGNWWFMMAEEKVAGRYRGLEFIMNKGFKKPKVLIEDK